MRRRRERRGGGKGGGGKGGEAGCSRGERDEGQRIEDEEKVDSK